MIEVTNVGPVRQDKRGRDYRVVTFTKIELHNIDGRIIKIKSNTSRSRNLWGGFKDEIDRVFEADNLFENIAVGDIIKGNIMTFDTEPYEIDGKKVNTATFVVFENEVPHRYAANEMKQHNVGVIDENGTLHKKEMTITKPIFEGNLK